MNTQISFKNLQYRREVDLYNKLFPVFNLLRLQYDKFEASKQNLEREFINLISSSLKVDNLSSVNKIIQGVNQNLNTDFKIDIFLNQSSNSNALCMPHFSSGAGQEDKLIVIVSQQFINDLNKGEQQAVLGHEMGHSIFGHIKIPARAILEQSIPMADAQALKSNVLKWSICCEISCDILGYIAGGMNKKAYISSLIKFITGLNNHSVAYLDEELLIDSLLSQYNYLCNSDYKGILTTHPLTPLRTKTINDIDGCNLVKNYGKVLDENKIIEYQNEFNNLIDSNVASIYPEIFPEKSLIDPDILLSLGIAVIVANGETANEELASLAQIINLDQKMIQEKFSKVSTGLSKNPVYLVVEDLVAQAINLTKQARLTAGQIRFVIRQLLLIAASDKKIENSELHTIFLYCKDLGITKQELFLIQEQMNLS